MKNNDLSFLINTVLSLKDIFLEGYFNRNKDIHIKSHRADLVTKYDKMIEEKLSSLLLKEYPDFNIIGEETFSSDDILDLENSFVIDPIDGTMNYIHNIPLVSISLAMIKDGQPYIGIIYNPISNELFFAQKDKGAFLNNSQIFINNDNIESSLFFIQPYSSAVIRVIDNISEYVPLAQFIERESLSTRSFRSSAIEIAYVAAGRLNGLFFHRTNLWDILAGAIILKEAGGEAYSLNGSLLSFDKVEINGGIFSSEFLLNQLKGQYYV